VFRELPTLEAVGIQRTKEIAVGHLIERAERRDRHCCDGGAGVDRLLPVIQSHIRSCRSRRQPRLSSATGLLLPRTNYDAVIHWTRRAVGTDDVLDRERRRMQSCTPDSVVVTHDSLCAACKISSSSMDHCKSLFYGTCEEPMTRLQSFCISDYTT